MKTAVALVMLVAMLAACDVALAQDQSSPESVVKLFKQDLDMGNTVGLLSLYTDPDIVAPLQMRNYPRLVDPMQTYTSAWSKRPFVMDGAEEIAPSVTVVYVSSPMTYEQVKFYTKSFGEYWYIDDVEVYGVE